MELSSLFVCLMGIGTVFAGLLCLVLICYLVGVIARDRSTEKAGEVRTADAAVSEIPNREELVAAVSAAVAEELGEDVSRIRILSFKRK